jgi:hypothetical protein
LTNEEKAMTSPQPASTDTPATPTRSTDAPEVVPQPEPAFGWTRYAEIVNGRFAMIGFVALLILEFFTRQDFFTWIGLR